MNNEFPEQSGQVANVVVTGGAGFIGSHLVHHLLRTTGWTITVVDNLYRGSLSPLSTALASSRVHFRETDIRDPEAVLAAFHGAQIVFHLAAQSNVMGAQADIDYSFGTNVIGTYNVLKAAETAGVQRVVFTSSREVYGDPASLPVSEDAPFRPKNAYGAGKATGEFWAGVFRTRGLDVRIARLANVYGPGDRDRVIPLFVNWALRGEPLIVYGGEQLVDFVWIGDVVEGLLAVASASDWPAPAINIASGNGTKILDLAQQIVEQTLSKSRVDVRAPRDIEVLGFVGNTDRCTQLLGRKPAPCLAFLSEVIG